ncbi:MAG: EutN/CcmL family microcompartment protein [Proteobacteria bacterium]|nr:EutN/CcmL family microcompartment protein [Pseudomonadota bacterium]MBU1742396.1 EutN/CcmL family microcompartment protein [Pseudomonadota bacterium]
MILCRVLGSVVASAHHPVYDGRKVLVVQPIEPEGQDAGPSFLAVDFVQAGKEDTVLVNREGSGARLVFGLEEAPVHSVIVGVVDQVTV